MISPKRFEYSRRLLGLAAVATCSILAPAQDIGQESRFPCPASEIKHYTSHKIDETLTIDGRLDEISWQQANRSPRFVDIISGKPTVHDTRAAVLWNEQNLYIGFWVEEPDVQGNLTKRDSPIYRNNDVEVFIAGKDAYYEFEINSLGTIYEVFFIWQEAYEQGGFDDMELFRRSNSRFHPFNGVGFRNHPRGKRWGVFNWDFPGLATAVQVDGTLNHSKDRDRRWTVELAFPWKGMEWLAKSDGRSLPPKVGDVWRIDFSRFNQYKEAPPATDSGGWVWSRHGVWDSHIPECFPYIEFSASQKESEAPKSREGGR